MTIALKVLSIVLIVTSLLLLVLVIVLRNSTGGYIPFDYGIVIDAGSSHNRVTLYKWIAKQVNATGFVHEVDDCKTHNGIDYNENKTQESIDQLIPCIQNVTQSIDYEEKGLTPLFLGATGGMRLFFSRKPVAAKYVLKSIENEMRLLAEGSNALRVKSVRILPGEDEALFAWVAANYLLDLLRDNSSDTVGVLDMGGASSQIAYQAKEEMKPVAITLNGHQYLVAAKSDLCFGSGEAKRRYLAILLMSNSDEEVIGDPCLHRGINRTIDGSYFLDSPCIKLKSQQLNVDPNKTYTFVGTSHSRGCSEIVSKIVNPSSCQPQFVHCFEAPKSSPPSDAKFIAVSSYYYVTRVLPMRDVISMDDFTLEMDRFCKKSWASLISNSQISHKYAPDYCFKLHYIFQYLTKVYKFNGDSWRNLRFQQKVNGKSLGWSLGLILNETQALGPPTPSPALISSFLFKVSLVTLICSTLLGAIMLLALKPLMRSKYHIQGLRNS